MPENPCVYEKTSKPLTDKRKLKPLFVGISAAFTEKTSVAVAIAIHDSVYLHEIGRASCRERVF